MPTKSSQPLIVANWKMYKTLPEALEFLSEIRAAVEASQTEAALAVPFTLIREAAAKAKESRLLIGAQNMNDAQEGAFTGEVSASMLKDAGASFVILGHSERRGYYKESDEFINRKVRRALDEGLRVILCIGESREDHDEGRIESRLKEQLLGSLNGVDAKDMANVVIAYEPVWAIGTGKAATSDEVSEESQVIRSILNEHFGSSVGDNATILYGGSVSQDNAQDYLKKKNINGLLVGSASLNSESFVNIISNP